MLPTDIQLCVTLLCISFTATDACDTFCRYGSFGQAGYTDPYLGPLSNCTAFSGSLPAIAENLIYNFNNRQQTFRSTFSQSQVVHVHLIEPLFQSGHDMGLLDAKSQMMHLTILSL